MLGLDAEGSRLLVSGDVGRPGHPLLLPPATPHDAETVATIFLTDPGIGYRLVSDRESD